MSETLKENTYKEILEIGIPSFLETLFTTFASIIDSRMVSRLGLLAISAVSLTNQPRLFIFSVFFALNTVVSSLIAKYLGKNDRDRANMIFDHVLKIVALLSIGLGIIAVIAARPIMLAFARQMDTLADSVLYFRIVVGFMIFNTLYMAINSALRGCGLTKLTFISNALSCVVNIFCNYLLIEGHLGFPALGIKGAAIATVTGSVAALCVSLGFAMRKKLFISIPYCLDRKYRMSRESISEICDLARSTVTDSIVMRFSLLFIGGVVARIGSFQTAVYSVGMHLLNVNTALGTGLQNAAVALIGRSYGADDRKAIREYRRAILKIGVLSAFLLGVLIVFGRNWFYSLFGSDPEFIRLGGISCTMIALITVVQTLKFINNGTLQGVGAMHETMVASIVSFAGVNLSTLIILVLVLQKGILGVWTATLLSQTVQASLLFIYIRKHRAFKATEE